MGLNHRGSLLSIVCLTIKELNILYFTVEIRMVIDISILCTNTQLFISLLRCKHEARFVPWISAITQKLDDIIKRKKRNITTTKSFKFNNKFLKHILILRYLKTNFKQEHFYHFKISMFISTNNNSLLIATRLELIIIFILWIR